jgi:hypothetical protein
MNSLLSKIIKPTLLIILFVIIFSVLAKFIRFLPLFDFIEYWSAGKLNLEGKNPYGREELYDLQTQLGWSYPDSLISWNPPWAQAFLMPLALLPYPISRTLWLLLSISIAIIAAQQTWKMYGGSPEKKWIALILTITFSPLFFNLMLGQISPVILFGLIGFWKLIERDTSKNWKNGLLAGFFASLMAIKPQITFILLVAILVWAINRKIWTIPIGFGLSILLEIAIAALFNPAIARQYLQALQEYPPNQWATPTLGYYLRLIFGVDKFWLQFLPAIMGICWYGFHWQKNRKLWNWRKEIPLLILVSIVTASYTWVHDQIVLIPVVIIMAIWILQNKPGWRGILFSVVYFLSNLIYLVFHFRWDDSRFVWLGLTFFMLYWPIHHSYFFKRTTSCI